MKNSPNHIFVDTNVLVGSIDNVSGAESRCLHRLYRISGITLYISSLSVAQVVALFQNPKLRARRKTPAEIAAMVDRMLAKFTIVGFDRSDIVNARAEGGRDMEDNFQYVVGQKVRCGYYITRNKKDFTGYLNITTLTPEGVRCLI